MGLIQVELREDESLTSFCSRLAAANARSAYELCQDFDFTFRKVVDGDEDAITALSRISGVDRELLDAAAVKRAGEHSVFVGEDPTPWNFYPRSVLRFCPSCFAEDDKRTDLRPRTRRYGRKTWYSRFIRTCPIHSQSLVTAGVGSSQNLKHDLCNTLGELRREVAIAATGSTHQQPSDLERYVLSRLKGEKPGNDLLCSLPIYVAGDICELAGMVALHGKKVGISNKSDHEWWMAGAAGFEYFKDGLPGLHRFLDNLHVKADHARAYYGGTQLYGKFHNALARTRNYPAYDLVKEEIRAYAYDTLPLTDNTSIFGRIENPRYLSFASFERKFGITPSFLRKVLVATRALRTLPGTNVEAIDAESSQLVACSIRDLVRSSDAADIVGCSYSIFSNLVKDGVIVPAITQNDDTGISAWFSRSDLIRLRDGVVAKGDPANREGLIGIRNVIRSVACSYGEILVLLIQDRVKQVGIDRSKFGIMSLMLDREEIKDLVRLPHHGCLSAADLSERWALSNKTVYALINNNHIELRIERNPETRSAQKVVAIKAVEAFESRYIRLAECCERSGLSPPKASNKLRAAGLARTFPKEQMVDAFYLRELAEAALGLAQVSGNTLGGPILDGDFRPSIFAGV
ncbi:MAG: TniQ family protein [Hydrogenophaga sp.]|nr:TniQ family protein [Hydrogenophaga sp.]